MANDIVAGLFGLSPFDVQQRQNEANRQYAASLAQADPFVAAKMSLGQAGAGLGQLGAGMMGMVNPEVEAAKQREAALSQVDFNTPEGILAAAKAAGERGDTKMNLQLQMFARQRMAEQQTMELQAAKTRKEEMLAEEAPRLRHEEKMAEIAQRSEAAKMRSEDTRLSAQMRSDALRESNDLKRMLVDRKLSQPQLSATEQKELFESDDMVQAAQNIQTALKQANDLNKSAYSGYFSKSRAVARSNLPGESEQANATIALDNIMTGQALESLKTLFGAMPTEGERKILLEMQASVEKTPAQRQEIINRAMTMAKRREQLSADKAEKLRSGEYRKPGGAPASKGGVKFLGFE